VLILLAACLANYAYVYQYLFEYNNKKLLLVYTTLLALQLFGSYYINPISGMLLVPVLALYTYLYSTFKDVPVYIK
jgi:hypothetical protein